MMNDRRGYIDWTPSVTPKVGDKIRMKVPPPLTWWDNFLWRWFRIERRRPFEWKDFVVKDILEIPKILQG